MKKSLFKVVAAAAVAGIAAAAPAAIDHLVMSEVGIGLTNQTTEQSAEYVEIFNPTTQPVSLDNYYFTDHNWYKNLPVTPTGAGFGSSDCLVRFPAGYTLQPGQVAVICGGATLFYKEFFHDNPAEFAALPGNPLLFQVGRPDAGTATQMISLNTNATTPNAFSMTNIGTANGEFGILFYWDGASDLVKDVDIVTWGGVNGTNAFTPKTPADLGKNGTPYLLDHGSHESMAIMNGNVIIRQTITETGETQTGGNGLTGHDESTENTPVTWTGFDPSQATPGTTTLGTIAQNQDPLVNEFFQSPQFPAAGSPVNVVVNAVDNDGTIAQVRVFYSTGGAFTPVVATANTATTFTASLGSFPAGTVVQYYAEVTDDDGAIAVSPPSAPTTFQTFLVEATPVMPGDIVINEILGDNKSSDAYEWVEIHNTRNTPVDLSFYRFADGNRNYFVFPSGTTIPAKGYVVLSLNDVEFHNAYPNLPAGTQVFDWGTFGLNNGGDDIVLVHPNAYLYRGVTTFLDQVVYDQVLETGAWNFLNQNSTGRTLELLNPFLDNSVPESWDGSVVPTDTTVLPGTPGARNSIFTAALVSPFRDKTFPGNNEAFTVSADVKPIEPGVTVSAVRLMVDTGSGFGANTMAVSTGTSYTKTLSGYPTGTIVKYYFEVDTSDGFTSRYPADGDVNPLVVIITPDAPEVGDVVINEILYNNASNDGYEFIELYNTTPNSIDLSFYKILTNALRPFTIPSGTTIAGNSYIIITQSDFAFRAMYGTPSVPLINIDGLYNMSNAGDNVRLIHPNQYNPAGESIPLDFVKYGVAPPWPSITPTDPNGQNPDSTGASIELINPGFADRGTNGDRWRWTSYSVPDTTNVMGTPGAQNSMYAGVSDWTLY